MLGGAASSDAGGGFVAAGDDFSDAAGCVFRGDAFEIRMREKELLALGESHGMRSDRANTFESCARAADELVLDGKNRFRDDSEIAFEEKIVDADDGASEGIFHGRQEGAGGAFRDGPESGIKCGTGNGGDPVAKQLDRGGFAEGAGLALKGDARGLAIRNAHRQALSCNKELQTRSEESCTEKEIRRHALGTTEALSSASSSHSCSNNKEGGRSGAEEAKCSLGFCAKSPHPKA